jgi:hypothetical protein
MRGRISDARITRLGREGWQSDCRPQSYATHDGPKRYQAPSRMIAAMKDFASELSGTLSR